MNYFLIAFLILMGILAIAGYSRGMVKEIISFVSLVFLSCVALLALMGITSYTKGRVIQLTAVVLLLAILGIVKIILETVFTSAKFIAGLPVVKWLDKVMGVAAGACESIVILWMLYAFVMYLDLGAIEYVLMEYVKGSKILTFFYEYNYLAYYLEPVFLILSGKLK